MARSASSLSQIVTVAISPLRRVASARDPSKPSSRFARVAARPTLQGVRSYQSEPPPSLSPGPGQGSKEKPSAGTQGS